jgi:hypothetical protein
VSRIAGYSGSGFSCGSPCLIGLTCDPIIGADGKITLLSNERKSGL